MTLTFRAKLMLIVAVAVLSGLVATAVSTLIGYQQDRDLADVEQRLVPRLELEPRVSAEFSQLRRSLQDAVAAEDPEMLSASKKTEVALLQRIADARLALAPREARALREAIEAYYELAEDVSRRLISGETGERIVEQMARMQAGQVRVERLVERSLKLDRAELERGFSAVHGANQRADRFRLIVGLAGMVLVLGLSIWLSRGVLRSLRHLSSGFARFATGDFARPIPDEATRDLGSLTQAANQMAASLQKLGEERERDAWLKAGQAALANELRGEMDPAQMAARALRLVAERIGAVAGALYLREESGDMALVGHFGSVAKSAHPERSEASPFRVVPGEGLVGEAALSDDVVVVEEVPADYFEIASGLGQAQPGTLVFLPLSRRGRTVGVAEFALFKTFSTQALQLLRSIRESLTMAFETANSRAELERLLVESRQQAERLAAQEEELRVSNGELQAQQEELRVANDELEEQRRALHDNNTRLEEAQRRLQEKADELSRVSSYKSQFLANMSHELRTPLNSMLLLSHLLGENEGGRLTAKQVEHCRTIYSAGEDLLGLINQILDLAKIEAGRQELHLESVPVEHFAHFARRRFGELAREKGLDLVVELESGLAPNMVTDTLRVERILTNLLGNAIKFTQKGSVALCISRPASDVPFQNAALDPKDAVAFVVSDTGVGIDSELHERIFKPFEQAETKSDRRYGGTGLGLAIARESATLLGGELRLESARGQGSTFTCTVPLRTAEQAAPAGLTKAEPTFRDRHGATSTAGGAKLLVIEDDAVLAEQLTEIIRARRLEALVAHTGREGLELACEPGIVGIVLDVRLPDMDGWSVMECLRHEPKTRSIPVHFVTAIDKPERGLALGAVGYLVKPVTHADLTNVVFTLTRTTDGGKPRLLVVEDNAREGRSIVELLRGEDVETVHVSSARAALDELDRDSFGCMILDLGLPDMDGLSLLEAVKAQTREGAPRVVVHTGRPLTKSETRQLDAYAEAVIVKDERSGERLLEEVRCFVRHLKEGLSGGGSATSTRDVPVRPDISLENVKLLLAEDDMRTVYALSALMLGKGAEVLVAENGKEALELIRANPDVQGVLMDIMMPEMDGYEAMRRLRLDPRFSALPVIALTAKAMKGERERCIAAGANDYVSKPVDAEHLLDTLSRWLRKDAVVVSH